MMSRPDEDIAALIQSMSKGQYLLLCAAVEKAGGSVSIPINQLALGAMRLPPRMVVDLIDDCVSIRIS